jgi:hypothetical protein
MTLLGARDPLFVAEFDPNLIQLEVPTMMRRFGLILENLDGFNADPRTRFVLRAVPHTLSLATSVTPAPDDLVSKPVERTGWGGDGSPGNGSLHFFQNGAITQHYTKTLNRVVGTDFRLATDDELSRMEQFMRRVGRMNELNLNTVTLSDPLAEAGRAKFQAIACKNCHFNAGANLNPNIGFGAFGNRNFNTGVEGSRNADLAGFPHDGGFGLTANPDGSFGDGTFNVPPLIEAADTGPFFHTAVTVTGASAHNTPFATTIEEAVAFYDSDGFRRSPSGPAANIDLTAQEIDNIARFLRALNAAFNVAQALTRLDAVTAVSRVFGETATTTIQFNLIRLAMIDLRDAVNELDAVNLNPDQSASLAQAAALLQNALDASTTADRLTLETQAMSLAAPAAAGIGTNINYVIGDGTVAF